MQKVVGLYEYPDKTICRQLNEYLAMGCTVAWMHDTETADGKSVLVVLNVPEDIPKRFNNKSINKSINKSSSI